MTDKDVLAMLKNTPCKINKEEGEKYCPKCNGSGLESISNAGAFWCQKCKGKGFVTWVEQIFN